MRLPVLLGALFGLAALVVALLSGGSRLAGINGPTASTPSPSSPQIPAAPPAAEAVKRPIARARPVAPGIVAPPDLAPESLERIAPRAPLGDLALAVPPKPGVPEKTLLHRPVATAAGRLEAQGHVVELDGIVPVEPERECRATDGSSWPCGMVARTAFRNWLRGRAVECVVGEPPSPDTVISQCGLAGQDVALWLVENGFATAKPGSVYVDAGDKAKAEGRGIFGPGPSAGP